MPSSVEFVKFITEQLENAGRITCKKMFGEYAIYSGNKLVALVCDDQLFVKPTDHGREFIGEVVEAPPYPGVRIMPQAIPGDVVIQPKTAIVRCDSKHMGRGIVFEHHFRIVRWDIERDVYPARHH